MKRKKILIISPLFWGDASGASVYYRLLAKALVANGYDVSVVSDGEIGDSELAVKYFPLFPVRCGRPKRMLRDIFAYAWQNVMYLRLPELVASIRPTAVLVHSSFYNHPGIFALGMKRVFERNRDTTFVLDVRDALSRSNTISEFNSFDSVIACSGSVSAHLRRHGVPAEKITDIPVMQERLGGYSERGQVLLREYGITSNYIFYAGLVKESKSVDLLLRVFSDYVRPRRPGVQLVVAGLLKTRDRRLKEMLTEAGVVYVGNRSRNDVLALMSLAALCVNLSENEGMPRSSLEALALKRPVVLPPNVPEFEGLAQDFVAHTRNPHVLGDLLLKVMDDARTPAYPIHKHLPDTVIEHYMALLSDERAEKVL